jgi:hypothetical protein
MTLQHFLLATIVSATAASSSLALASERSAAPQADCMDARIAERVYVVSPWQLVVALQDDQRFRIELGEACPAVTQPDVKIQLLAPDGWACGAGDEVVQVSGADTAGSAVCSVAALAPVDRREFARLAREASRNGSAGDAVTLAPVEVVARRPRGFRGTTDFCFASRHVRGWHEDGDGLVVDVSPLRSGGNTRYRIELASSCIELGAAEDIVLRSGVGNGLICGHTGDQVVAQARPVTGALVSMLDSVPATQASGCQIREVYPLKRS